MPLTVEPRIASFGKPESRDCQRASVVFRCRHRSQASLYVSKAANLRLSRDPGAATLASGVQPIPPFEQWMNDDLSPLVPQPRRLFSFIRSLVGSNPRSPRLILGVVLVDFFLPLLDRPDGSAWSASGHLLVVRLITVNDACLMKLRPSARQHGTLGLNRPQARPCDT